VVPPIVYTLRCEIENGGLMQARSNTVLRKVRALVFECGLLASTGLIAGCDNDAVNTEPLPSPSAVASAVVGKAAASLDQSGRFTQLQENASDELTAGQAVQLANAYAKQFLPLEHTYLEKQRGGAKIDLKSISACGRALYAASAFERLPEIVPAPNRRPYGSYWLVTLCAKGSPQVSLAVSAQATDLTIVNGRIQFPFYYGGEFFSQGIPVGHQGEFPSTPEQAAVRASRLSRRHVTNVPDLIMPAMGQGVPQEARWHVDLDSSTDVYIGSNKRSTDVLYTGSVIEGSGKTTPVHYLAASEQPASVQFSYVTPPNPHENIDAYDARRRATGDIMVTATRRSSQPIKFEMVSRAAQ
jgi:hypothetical protein